jgi:hypothetical protein
VEVVCRHGQVGVGHEAPGAACFLHPAPYGGSLSTTAAAHQPDARIAL